MSAFSDRTYTARRWKLLTASTTAALEPKPVALRANVAGDIVIIGDDGVSGTFAVDAGQVLECQPTMLMSTGTTATGIYGLYN